MLIHWTHVGIGQLGEDLASLVFQSVLSCDVEPDSLPRLSELAFEGYLEGLHDAGWRGDPRLLRLRFAATAALRHSLFQTLRVFTPSMSEHERQWQESYLRRQLAQARSSQHTVRRSPMRQRLRA